MSNTQSELNQRILEMSEGDDEFRLELTTAIFSGLQELKSNYTDGAVAHDELKIQQIRHKIKPTVAMFDFGQLADSLQQGKEILESEGFGIAFESHFTDFIQVVDGAIAEVERLRN